MDIQAHSRTVQIKRLSRHLLHALTLLRFVLYLLWPLVAFVAFTPGGTYILGDTEVTINESNTAWKWFILLLYAGGLTIMIIINHHFRELMKQFTKGHIFSDRAIGAVRGALRGGIAFALMSVIQAASGSIYNYQLHSTFDISFTTEAVIAGIYFGLMFTLLWALEIGRDLNDESRMTI